MKEIDELVPLTDADIKTLQEKIGTPNIGCAIFLLVVFLAMIVGAFFLLFQIFLLGIVLGAVALFVLLMAIGAFTGGSKEKNEKLARDIQEGKKRHIIAPIEMKDSVDVTPNKIPLSVRQQVRNSYRELKLEYFMMVKGYKFDLTEEQFLAGARKGDLVEFYVAPHSGEILSEATAVRE